MRIKVLSIQEPWASLILNGKKTIELRTWRNRYRGELYIHATTNKGTCRANVVGGADLLQPGAIRRAQIGTICGKVILEGVKFYRSTDEYKADTPHHRYSGEIYANPLYGWVLKKPVFLEHSFRTKGRLGIWEFEVPEYPIIQRGGAHAPNDGLGAEERARKISRVNKQPMNDDKELIN